ncbi:UNC93-like protein 2 [Elsinoe fawcettii]|nr:UNC93-like protein 2 [Elsinoe fawcettii]
MTDTTKEQSAVETVTPVDEDVTPNKKFAWRHGTLFNAFVIGGVGFIAPGLWNALSALGAGGAQEPFLVNAANALVFGLMAILCILGGPIANRIGLARTLALGAIGYPLYSAGLYTNNKFGNVWLVLVGATTCGISAGLFWASEGAVALGYPEPEKRGKYMNIWLWFRVGGPLLGGLIVLALNNDASAKAKGKVGSQTYLVFVALQCLGAPIALLLSKPEQVIRKDGSKVIVRAEKTFKGELRALWKLSARKDILLLLPVFWAAYFNQFSGNFQTYYFGVRARALIGFVSNFGTLLSSQIMSMLLDYKDFPVKKRINIGFYYVVAWHVIAWVYGWVINEKYTRNQPAFDWEDAGFVEGFFVLLLWDFARQALQNWLYYLLATKTDNISELSRFSGILRGQESLAQAVSYGLNTRKWKGGRVPLAVNTVLLGLAVYLTWLVVRDHVPVETKKATDQQSDEEEVGTETITNEEKEKFAVGRTGLGRDGKTTLAAQVAKRLNELHHKQSPGLALSDGVAAFLPMDGYHLSRAQLDAMPEPDTAHARRGAAFTFDAPAFLALAKRLREPLCAETTTIYAPSFDHAVKDPLHNDIPIHPSARILVFEGNYCSLGTGAKEWKEAAELMDELWFVDVDLSVARQRLIQRHVKAGLAENEEQAAKRADENDLVNGKEIIEGRLPVHEVIQSREDDTWKPERQGERETASS